MENKNKENEREKEEMEKRLEELEEKIEQLKRLQQSDNEAKNKLRQETSRLTAENMVCVCASNLCRWSHQWLGLVLGISFVHRTLKSNWIQKTEP